MTRTAVSVLGDSCAHAIIGKSEGKPDTIRPSDPKFHSLAKLMKFKLVSDYKPQGDQPEAIDSWSALSKKTTKTKLFWA